MQLGTAGEDWEDSFIVNANQELKLWRNDKQNLSGLRLKPCRNDGGYSYRHACML